jgi:hypothetical protein
LDSYLGLERTLLILCADLAITVGSTRVGVISPAAFFWLVAMALFTTVITTPILTRLYPSPEAAVGFETTPESRRAR